MAKVTYGGLTYTCAKAFKGPDYIHLVDSKGVMIAAFDKVVNFSAFSIADGSWSTPTPDSNCYVAVVRDDGTIGKGSHKCNEIGSGSSSVTEYSGKRCKLTLSSSGSSWDKSGSIYSKLFTVNGIKATDLVAICPETQDAWARSYLGIVVKDGSILVNTSVLPPDECVLYLYIISTSTTVELS